MAIFNSYVSLPEGIDYSGNSPMAGDYQLITVTYGWATNIVWATNSNWLVVSNMAVIFHFIYGMSSFPLTNSYFSRWLLHHQPVKQYNA